jgi:sulfite exporter TauE/SafE
MCGGFVLAIGAPRADVGGRRPWRLVATQAVFHLVKGSTYVLLGGVAGLVGTALARAPWVGAAQAALSVAAGVLMALAGLQLLGVLRELPVGGLFGPGSWYDRAVRSVLNLRGWVAPAALGALTGLLPCPLVYAFLAAAASTGAVLPAMGTMALLALCSLPALALVAATGQLLAPAVRARFVRAGGALVVVLGVVTVLRGLFPEWIHLGH